jgi:hypothetical protein
VTKEPAVFVVYGYLFELHFAPAIVLIEAIIAKRILDVSFVKSVLLAGVASAVSALVGLLLVLPATFWMSVRGSLEAGAFLVFFLCVPLCLVSILIESRVAVVLLRNSHNRLQCREWSREANLASYLMVAGVSAAIVVASWMYRARGLI